MALRLGTNWLDPATEYFCFEDRGDRQLVTNKLASDSQGADFIMSHYDSKTIVGVFAETPRHKC